MHVPPARPRSGESRPRTGRFRPATRVRAVASPGVSAPDPADLRLVAALAEAGRTTVLDLAGRAGMSPVEAADRLLRLGASGLRLVVGAEGDQAALRSWLAVQAPPVPVGQVPVRSGWSSPAPVGAAAPAPPTPAPGWGVPPSAGWTRPPPSGAPSPPGSVGDRLDGSGPGGERVGVTVVEVIDTADALFRAAGHTLRPGTRAAVVHTEVAAGSSGYPTVPDTGLVLVLDDGRLVTRSAATMSSRAPFRGGVPPNTTDGGHTVFELDAQATIRAVRWRAAPGAPALEWLV